MLPPLCVHKVDEQQTTSKRPNFIKFCHFVDHDDTNPYCLSNTFADQAQFSKPQASVLFPQRKKRSQTGNY